MQILYGKNGSAPQVKRNIRKFAGFEFPKNSDDYKKTIDRFSEYDLPQLVETAMILKLEEDDLSTMELATEAIMDFLMAPYGKTIAQEQREKAAAEKDDELEDAEDEEEEEEEDEEPATKKKPAGGKKRASDGSRPKRATAARVWTNNYGSSDDEEEEEVEEEKPKIRKKNNKGGSDSGSDVSILMSSIN